MRVEWAEGRRALVWFPWGVCWRECVGVLLPTGAHGWEPVLRGDPPADDRDVKTALLPGQCPRCFEVDDHEQGCVAKANLARGVPPFWAPWAMVDPVPPSVWTRFNGVGLYGLNHEAGQDARACALVTSTGPKCDSWVAIGADGPTLEPWEG